MKKNETDGFEEIDLEDLGQEKKSGTEPDFDPNPVSGNEEMDDQQQGEKESIMKEAVSFLIWAACVLLISFLLVHFVIQRCDVGGSSMVPTLTDGDQLLMDKISYRFRDPERFDIVVFPYEYSENTYFIKRVIGLPGETVQIDYAGTIYINGEPLEEHYGAEVILYPGLAEEEIQLGDDEYFVLGDNRNVSEDSRYPDVGNIKRERILGRPFLRIYPFSSFGLITDR